MPVKDISAPGVKTMIPGDGSFEELAEFFKVFGDATRIKIIATLFSAPCCVNDIADSLGMTQSAVSHQLRILKNMRLVHYKKEGKNVSYSLDDEHIKTIFDDGLSHVTELYTRGER
jgi:ArsR family transcriptional regulator